MTSLYDCGGSSGSIIDAGLKSPSNPRVGDVWFDIGTDQLKKWDGTAWQIIALGGGPGLPPATRRGQVLVAGPTPAFAWTVADSLDSGRY